MKLDEIRAKKAESAQFMVDEITTVCKNFKDRDPGSESEKGACEYMADQLSEYCDDVKLEPFEVHPASFMGWIYITVTCTLLAFVTYFFANFVSIALLIAGVIPMLLQFVFYTRALDPLYPKKVSHNITAVKHCTGEVKSRIFFNGHPDAVWEWTTNYKFGGAAFITQVVLCFVGILYVFCIDIAKWVAVQGIGASLAEGTYLYIGLAGLVFVPFWIYTYFLSNTKVIVDGANDNLTGCYMGISILKALKDNNVEFENTEVGVIISGSEEAGLRGAKAWTEQHKGEYQDVPTIIVSYDTIRDKDFLQINRRDLNATVKCDVEGSDLFAQAGKNANIKVLEGTVPLGATDAAAFTQGKFRAVGITALNHVLQDYYHTRKDSYDNLNAECLADCFDVSVEFLKLWDEKNK